MLTAIATQIFLNLREAVVLYVAVLPATESWISTMITNGWSFGVSYVTAAIAPFRRG